MSCFDHGLDSPHELFGGHKALDDAFECWVNVGQSHAVGMRVTMALPTMSIVISVGDTCIDGAPASASGRPFAMHSRCWC